MILHQFQCNICQHRINYHPECGLNGLLLYAKGPTGAEGAVLVEDDCPTMAPHLQIHICRICEGALSKFFKDRKAA